MFMSYTLIYSATKYIYLYAKFIKGVKVKKKKKESVKIEINEKEYEGKLVTGFEKSFFLIFYVFLLSFLLFLFYKFFDESLGLIYYVYCLISLLGGISFFYGFIGKDKKANIMFLSGFGILCLGLLLSFIIKITSFFYIASFLIGWILATLYFWGENDVYVTEDKKYFILVEEKDD